MNPYLIIQYPYEHLEISLCKNGSILSSETIHKFLAIKSTIPSIESLLKKHAMTINDVSCIGVNCGPGPYNTLRSMITFANGIHFVNKVSLISHCSLDLLLEEYNNQPTVVIFNAFAQHLFYAFNSKESQEKGHCSIDEFIKKLDSLSEKITIIGNGIITYKEQLEKLDNILIPEELPLFNSSSILAQKTFEKLEKKEFAPSYLEPIYLNIAS